MDPQFKAQLEELHKDGRKADKLDKERAEAFAVMVKTKGWALYTELLMNQIQVHGDRLMDPAGTVDGAVFLEYVKGTLRGLIMARDLPAVIIDAMKPAGPATDGDDE